MPWVRRAPIAVFVAAVVLTACSSSTKPPGPNPTVAPSSPAATTTTAAPTPTSAVRSTVQIVSLTGPLSPVICSAPTQVQLHWTTQGATRIELRIDGGAIFSTYPGGAREPLVPLTCDGGTHSYELTARGANGDTATRTLRLSEREPAT